MESPTDLPINLISDLLLGDDGGSHGDDEDRHKEEATRTSLIKFFEESHLKGVDLKGVPAPLIESYFDKPLDKPRLLTAEQDLCLRDILLYAHHCEVDSSTDMEVIRNALEDFKEKAFAVKAATAKQLKLQQFSGLDKDYNRWRLSVMKDLDTAGLLEYLLDPTKVQRGHLLANAIFQSLRHALPNNSVSDFPMHYGNTNVHPSEMWAYLEGKYNTPFNEKNGNMYDSHFLMELLEKLKDVEKFYENTLLLKEFISNLLSTVDRLYGNNPSFKDIFRGLLLNSVPDNDKFHAFRSSISNVFDLTPADYVKSLQNELQNSQKIGLADMCAMPVEGTWKCIQCTSQNLEGVCKLCGMMKPTVPSISSSAAPPTPSAVAVATKVHVDNDHQRISSTCIGGKDDILLPAHLDFAGDTNVPKKFDFSGHSQKLIAHSTMRAGNSDKKANSAKVGKHGQKGSAKSTMATMDNVDKSKKRKRNQTNTDGNGEKQARRTGNSKKEIGDQKKRKKKHGTNTLLDASLKPSSNKGGN